MGYGLEALGIGVPIRVYRNEDAAPSPDDPEDEEEDDEELPEVEPDPDRVAESALEPALAASEPRDGLAVV